MENFNSLVEEIERESQNLSEQEVQSIRQLLQGQEDFFQNAIQESVQELISTFKPLSPEEARRKAKEIKEELAGKFYSSSSEITDRLIRVRQELGETLWPTPRLKDQEVKKAEESIKQANMRLIAGFFALYKEQIERASQSLKAALGADNPIVSQSIPILLVMAFLKSIDRAIALALSLGYYAKALVSLGFDRMQRGRLARAIDRAERKMNVSMPYEKKEKLFKVVGEKINIDGDDVKAMITEVMGPKFAEEVVREWGEVSFPRAILEALSGVGDKSSNDNLKKVVKAEKAPSVKDLMRGKTTEPEKVDDSVMEVSP